MGARAAIAGAAFALAACAASSVAAVDATTAAPPGTVEVAADGPVTWGEQVTLAEGGAAWGRLARLANGDWLAIHTRLRKGTHSTLAVLRSRDRARSWTPLSTIAVDGRTLDNGELLVLPDGAVLAAMRSLVDGKSYRLDVHRSDDAGASWRFLSNIDRNESPGGRKDRGLWEPTLALLDDGTISVIYADETEAGGDPAYAQRVSQRVSTDGGATWGPKIDVASEPGGGRLRPGMGVMTRLADGRRLVVFEICGEDPQCPVMSKVSADGRDWAPGLGTPVPGHLCGPHAATARDGRVFVTSCANIVGWSDDGGARWARNRPAAWPEGFRHSWPAVYAIGPGEIAVVNGVKPGVVGIRFGRYPPRGDGATTGAATPR